MTVQPFVNYNFGKGWYVSSGPIITANWAAHGSDDTWTVPVGGGFGRIIRIGKLPVNLSAQAFESGQARRRPDRRLDAAPAGPVPVPEMTRQHAAWAEQFARRLDELGACRADSGAAIAGPR